MAESNGRAHCTRRNNSVSKRSSPDLQLPQLPQKSAAHSQINLSKKN